MRTAATRATEVLSARLRGVVAASVAVLVAGVLAGCEDEAARPVRLGGVQVADAQLHYWLGTDCTDVTSISVELTQDRSDDADKVLDTWGVEADGDASLETLTLGDVPDGYTEVDPLDVDWRSADIARYTFAFDDEDTLQVIDLRTVRDEAPDHPDEWYVTGLAEVTGEDPDAGWYSEDGYRDLLVPDEGITPICTT